jgi:cytochrome c556
MTRRFTIGLCATLVALAGVVAAQAQAKLSLENYAALMKSNAQARESLTKAIDASAWDDARALGTLRKNYLALRPFWTERKRTDAAGFIRAGMSQMAMMEETMGRANTTGDVPQAEVLAAAKELAGTCASCHTAYRDGNSQAGFRFKPGVF